MLFAGPPGERPSYKKDGKLQTWLSGPVLEPTLVVDRHDMRWRQFTNVSIDTLYLSTFFGGSSPDFRASKDEVCTARGRAPLAAVHVHSMSFSNH